VNPPSGDGGCGFLVLNGKERMRRKGNERGNEGDDEREGAEEREITGQNRREGQERKKYWSGRSMYL
jgi:hypothetical protein